MNFAIEDSPEQSAFRTEVQAFFAQNIPSNLEQPDVDEQHPEASSGDRDEPLALAPRQRPERRPH